MSGETFLNPYHFIPLAPLDPSVLREADTVLRGNLHNRFDGYSGRIVCRLETEGPVVVGAERRPGEKASNAPAEVWPCGIPDPAAPDDPYRRTPMIPGSTLRGLISALVEASSCSTLRVLGDGRFRRRVGRGPKEDIEGSVHTAVARVSPDLIPLNKERSSLTLAEQLFGFVEHNGSRALAGRLRFSHALVESKKDGDWYDPAVTLKVLDSPKPPSPALYFGNQGYRSKASLDLNRLAPQGRKMYLHHRKEDIDKKSYESHARDDKGHLRARVRPIKERTVFLFHVDFDNLSRQELGYLLFALRPTADFRHKLGMGRPLGLGPVRIDPLALCFIDRREAYSADSLFGPKYHSIEAPGGGSWPGLSEAARARYRHELAGGAVASNTPGRFPASGDLVRETREAIPKRVRWALKLLGNPDTAHEEVTYPVLLGQKTEGEHFRWFVANDKVYRQPMTAIEPGKPLPTLRRHKPLPR